MRRETIRKGAYVLAILLFIFLVWTIASQVREYHLQDDPMLTLLKQLLEPVHPIFKDMKLYASDKSFTINKKTTFLCLKDKNGEYYPLNMLVHVLLHEVAHSLNTTDVGHTENFHKMFDQLLARATELGVYNPSIPVIQDYCMH